MKEYKFSYYNEIFTMKEKLFIYNYITGGIGEFNDEVFELYKRYGYSDELLQGILSFPELKEELIQAGMLIENGLNEIDYLRYLHYGGRFANRNCFTLTLLPTNACNCRCPYCFEKDFNYSEGFMSEQVQDKIIEMLDKSLDNNGKLELTWFGGEPLLGINVIKNFYKKINELVRQKNLQIFSSLITNGTLLTKSVSIELIHLGIEKIQVTLDGPKSLHDKKRKLISGEGTFDSIINNILNADPRLHIMLRININKENINHIEELLDELNEFLLNKRDNVSIYFGLVRDYSLEGYKGNIFFSSIEYSKLENELHKLAKAKGFRIELFPHENIANCGAIFPNTLVVEADGTLQKCWNTVGDKSKCVGNILSTEEENEIVNPNLVKWLGWNPLEKEKCLKCKKLPICFGGCPYFGIYDSDPNYAYECNPVALNSLDRIKEIVESNS